MQSNGKIQQYMWQINWIPLRSNVIWCFPRHLTCECRLLFPCELTNPWTQYMYSNSILSTMISSSVYIYRETLSLLCIGSINTWTQIWGETAWWRYHRDTITQKYNNTLFTWIPRQYKQFKWVIVSHYFYERIKTFQRERSWAADRAWEGENSTLKMIKYFCEIKCLQNIWREEKINERSGKRRRKEKRIKRQLNSSTRQVAVSWWWFERKRLRQNRWYSIQILMRLKIHDETSGYTVK